MLDSREPVLKRALFPSSRFIISLLFVGDIILSHRYRRLHHPDQVDTHLMLATLVTLLDACRREILRENRKISACKILFHIIVLL